MSVGNNILIDPIEAQIKFFSFSFSLSLFLFVFFVTVCILGNNDTLSTTVNSIRVVKPDKADMVEMMLIQMARSGRLPGKVGRGVVFLFDLPHWCT